jgi:hypothetical protein
VDNYPTQYRPLNDQSFEKEPFQAWWQRVGHAFPTVPKNVARQWLWRHWDLSRWGWLPSSTATFTIQMLQPSDVKAVVAWRYPEAKMIEMGRHLLSQRFSVASIMARRRRWPAPPILLSRTDPVPGEPWPDIPIGLNLVEGHRRMEMAKALAADDLLEPNLPIWIIRY